MPATDLERLVVSLSADFKAFERGLARAQGVSNRQFGAIEARARKLNRNLDVIGKQAGGSFIRGFGGAVAAGFSAQGVKTLLDSGTKIQNALKVTGLAGEDLTKTYGALYEAAQRNAAPLEGLATLYSRVALSQKELGVSSQQIVGLVDNVGKAIKLSGGDAAQASGALLQLGQALGGGRVQAEEFNSLIDGLPGVLQAAAAGISEAGGSVAKLTALVKDGKVSSKAFFDGIAAGASVLDGRLATAEETISGGFTRLQNVLVDTATRFDDSTDASKILANFLSGPLSKAIREVGDVFVGVGEGPIGQFIGWVGKAVDAAVQAAADLGAATGLDKIGGNPYIGPGRIQDRIDGAFDGIVGPSKSRNPAGVGAVDHLIPRREPTEITITDPNRVKKPITLADYPILGDKDGKTKRTRQDDFAREVEQIRERTAAIKAETVAMAGVNPLINDYGLAIEKARAGQDLLTAAQSAGIAITPELRAKIEELAGAYALASVESAKLAEGQDRAREAAEALRDAGTDIMGGFIRDMLDGKSAADALANALSNIADRLLNSGLDALFGGGSAGGAILGDTFSLNIRSQK
ncbi:hypothetical protein Amn_24130 [Aminobacter sp. Y103A]|uniref:tape measure protein n=1 Tax=Aminobacter sp. Y103A TaxID=1870862 RepID=UPI0025731BA6|nr:tape measure protein [Aminobacter sp. SS-2016]BBD37533.1 hypothetical protein Amn_24130 [Aminobacter sp. SS-2016]